MRQLRFHLPAGQARQCLNCNGLKGLAAAFRLRYALGIIVSKFLAVLLFVSLAAPAEEPVDLAVVHRIKSEAFENSKAMEHLFYLTDVYGPRLTNSPGFRA